MVKLKRFKRIALRCEKTARTTLLSSHLPAPLFSSNPSTRPRASEEDLLTGLKLPRRDIMQMSAHRASDISAVVSHNWSLKARYCRCKRSVQPIRKHGRDRLQRPSCRATNAEATGWFPGRIWPAISSPWTPFGRGYQHLSFRNNRPIDRMIPATPRGTTFAVTGDPQPKQKNLISRPAPRFGTLIVRFFPQRGQAKSRSSMQTYPRSRCRSREPG
jgi:hypothetical protein